MADGSLTARSHNEGGPFLFGVLPAAFGQDPPSTLMRCSTGQSHSDHIYGSYDTLTHMKTTVELPDSLLREAKRVAIRERTTVRALIERGLRTVIGGRRPGRQFVLRTAGFRGDGLVAGRSLRDWETIRDLSYSERGA
jgi:hypothetical protein